MDPPRFPAPQLSRAHVSHEAGVGYLLVSESSGRRFFCPENSSGVPTQFNGSVVRCYELNSDLAEEEDEDDEEYEQEIVSLEGRLYRYIKQSPMCLKTCGIEVLRMEAAYQNRELGRLQGEVREQKKDDPFLYDHVLMCYVYQSSTNLVCNYHTVVQCHLRETGRVFLRPRESSVETLLGAVCLLPRMGRVHQSDSRAVVVAVVEEIAQPWGYIDIPGGGVSPLYDNLEANSYLPYHSLLARNSLLAKCVDSGPDHDPHSEDHAKM